MPSLAAYFDLAGRRTSVAREARGALATFLTMAYILFVNPQVLAPAGVPFDAAVCATALAAGIACLLMGLIANFPIALASGMGLNAVVVYQLAPAAGSWQAAMGLIVLDGLVVLMLVLTGLREAVMHAIPRSLRLATGAGIGLFIAFIGLVNAGLVVKSGAPGVPVEAGKLGSPGVLVATFGLVLTALLMARRVTGALLIGIAASTALALALGVSRLPTAWAAPRFDTFFQADILGALRWDLMPLLFAVLMVDFFDTLGTASAIADQAGLVDVRTARVPGIRRVLAVDAASASLGGLLGCSSVTCYIESASGVAEGARTGLHTALVGLLFLACVFVAPLAGVVPKEATAPALILVGFLMIGQMAGIDFGDSEEAIPAFLTLLVIPMTYSIAHGIGYGFIAHVAIKLAAGRPREVHPLLYAVTAAFIAWFAYEAMH